MNSQPRAIEIETIKLERYLQINLPSLPEAKPDL